ncbi:hypothetical protein CPC08DRAFT_645179 [Agrocybe pediades]|nr:hypothetical protein CPC08DRAFT_645179 [Agrocybe pediades]
MPRTIPLPPQTQARSSSTFNPPLVDGTLSLPEQYEWHAKHSPNHPLFIYATDNLKNIRTILWKEAVKAMHNGARLIRRKMGWVPGMKNPPVIAILAASDTITYFTTLISILRAGYIGFAISPRNSPAAVAHIINKAVTGHILATFEPRSPAIAPTPKNHFEGAVACNCDIVLSVPTNIEAWSRQPDYVKWLSKCGGVLYGGGPLDKTVGDYLTSKGVPIFNLYGLTEGGMMTFMLPGTTTMS